MNLEKYQNVFTETLGIEESQLENLKYQDVDAWDSIGHMGLITALEETFSIMFETDDIIDMNSFAKGKEILRKYNVEL
jgi:acyl carrier protein